MRYLTREHISHIVNHVGQPAASLLITNFFNGYRHTLTSADVAALYDEQYFNALNTHELYLEEKGKFRLNIYHKSTFEYILKKISAETRILDIGCGNGDFAIALASRNVKEVVGIDFSQRAIDNANQKLASFNLPCRFICADIADLQSQDKYHFILLNDVSEHLADSELVPLLKKIHQLLAPRGELLIHTPNGLAVCNDTDKNFLQMLFKLYLRCAKGWRGTERSIDQLYYSQVHINIKSFRQLKSLLSQCGFNAKVYYDNGVGKRGFLKSLSSNMLVVATAK